MLINFTVENFKSFKDKTTLSMISSDEITEKKEHLIKPTDDLSLLPITAIYGANAAGKSNLIKAMDYAVDFVVSRGPLNYSPFKLDDCKEKASSFAFLFMANNNIYEYSFSITDKTVEQEKLLLVHNGKDDEELFLRNKQELNLSSKYKGKEKTTLDVLFKGTKDNRLFITNLNSQNNESFKDIYDWFKNLFIVPSSNNLFNNKIDFFNESNELYSEISNFLNKVDTGINDLYLTELEKYSEDTDIDVVYPKGMVKDFVEKRIKKDGDTFSIGNYIFGKINNEIMLQKKYTIHNNIKFDLEEESDGTQRLIDLLPIFFKLKNKVVICDEIDNSLHPSLLLELVRLYLEKKETHSNQLIFTTHTSTLLSSNLLRKDEIVAVNKKSNASSYIESFSEYVESLNDKDLEKSYLIGRLGGVPRI